MGEKIRPDQIRGLKVFDSTSSRLDLCKPHRARLGEKIAGEVNTLIQSPFFREKFSNLYRDVKSGSHFNIRLTDHSLIVQLMRRDATDGPLVAESAAMSIHLSDLDDGEIIGINETILNKANAAFRKCQREHFRSHRSSSPIARSRASSLSAISTHERSGLEPNKKSPSHRRAASWSSGTSSKATSYDTLQEELRRAHQAKFDLKLSADKLPSNAPTKEFTHLLAQMTSLEKQIEGINQKLEIIHPSIPKDSIAVPIQEQIHERLAQVETRLAKIEELLLLLQTPKIVPAASPDPSHAGSSPRKIDSGEEIKSEESRLEVAEAMAKVAALENALKATRSDMQKLEDDAGSKEQTISFLSQDIQRASERETRHLDQIDQLIKNTQLSSQATSLEKTLKTAQKEIEELEKDLRSKDETISLLNRDAVKIAEERNQYQRQVEQLTSALNENTKTHAQVAAFEEKLKAAMENIERLEKDALSNEKAFASMQENAKKVAEQRDSYLAQIQKLSTEQAEQNGRINTLHNEMSALTKKDTEQQRQIAELEGSISDLERQLAQAQKELAKKEEAHGLKESSFQQLSNQYQKIKTDYDTLLNQSKKSEGDLNKKLNELEQTTSKLTTELKNAQHQINNAQNEIQAKDFALKLNEAHLRKTKKQLDSTLKAQKDAQRAAEEQASLMKELEKKLQTMERVLLQEKEKVSAGNALHETLRENFNKSLQNTEDLLAASKKEKLAQQGKIDKLEQMISELSTQMKIEKDKFQQLQQEQQRNLSTIEGIEKAQKELAIALEKTTQERDALLSQSSLLKAQNAQHVQDLDELERNAKKLQEELENIQRTKVSHKEDPADQSANEGVNAAVQQGQEAAQNLDEIITAMSDEPLYFLDSELDSHMKQSLIEGYRLNLQLSQISSMSYDKKSQKLKVDISEKLAQELKIPQSFTLHSAPHLLGEEFKLNSRNHAKQIKEISNLPLIKRLNGIRGELQKAAYKAESSDATPWKTWGEVFKNFTGFCRDLNEKLPALNLQMRSYRTEFEQLQKELKVEEKELKAWIITRKAPQTISQEQQERVNSLIKLHRALTKNCERTLLKPLPEKVPLHHAWKITLLTKHGLPARAYTNGNLNETEARVVRPLENLMSTFYERFANMLERVQIQATAQKKG